MYHSLDSIKKEWKEPKEKAARAELEGDGGRWREMEEDGGRWREMQTTGEGTDGRKKERKEEGAEGESGTSELEGDAGRWRKMEGDADDGRRNRRQKERGKERTGGSGRRKWRKRAGG